MNILFVTHDFALDDGGIPVFNYHICKELSELGHKIFVLTNSFPGGENFSSQQKYSICRVHGKIRPTSVETICKILYLTLKEKIEVVFFGHFCSTHWLGGVLVHKILKIPYLILIHGTEFNAYYKHLTRADKWASKFVLRNASEIIVNSDTTKILVEGYGYPKSQIHIVHPGTDTVNSRRHAQESNIIEEYGLQGKKILMTASRLVAKKNHENVLKSLPLVIKVVPDIIYIIIGKGKEEEKLIRLTKYLGVGKYVKFVGFVEPKDMPMYYDICDIFIMPSKTVDFDYESFGIVYIEANACGKPVIGGKSGGVGDAVIDGVTGVLVDPENIEEIAQTIIRLLTDREYARKLGENGRRRVENELNWKTTGKKIEEVLVKLLKE